MEDLDRPSNVAWGELLVFHPGTMPEEIGVRLMSTDKNDKGGGGDLARSSASGKHDFQIGDGLFRTENVKPPKSGGSVQFDTEVEDLESTELTETPGKAAAKARWAAARKQWKPKGGWSMDVWIPLTR